MNVLLVINLMSNNILGSNILSQSQFGEIENMISQTNIEIIKCYKDILEYKYFISSTGGFMIIGLIICQFILVIIYNIKSIYLIKKYIFNITSKFLSYLSNQNNNIELNNRKTQKSKTMKFKEPPKRKSIIININQKFTDNNINRKIRKAKTSLTKKKKKTIKLPLNSNDLIDQSPKNIFLKKMQNGLMDTNINSSYINSKLSSKISKSYDKQKYNYDYAKNKSNEMTNKCLFSNKYIKNDLNIGLKDDLDINLNEYLSTDVDDMDYDDALKKDKRKFCEYFSDKFK